MRLLTVCFLTLLVPVRFCTAQDTLTTRVYFTSYLTDTRDIILAPLSWDKKDIVIATVTAGVTAGLMFFDESVDEFIFRNYNENLGDIFEKGIEPFGSGLYSVPLMGVLWVAGNDYDKTMALTGLKTFLISAGEATVIKMAFQRHRPTDDVPPDAWQFDGPFRYFSDDGSFVSRHAVTSFALAAYFSDGYKGRKNWVPWVAYPLASLVTFSRVYNRDHWFSDAFGGACLGYITGKFMFKLNKKYLHKL